jgi:uncharacterized protein (TIGR01777 family)
MSSELVVERRTPLPASPDEVYAWHARPGALERLVPPWQTLSVLERSGGITEGSRVRLRIHAGPVWTTWTAEHREVEPGVGFSDFQVEGPFDRWFHRHSFEPAPGGGSILHDRIVCELPLGIRLGRACLSRELERLLAYRHAVTAQDLAMHARTAGRPKLRIAITGSSGLIGSMLVPALTTGGHKVIRMVRRAPASGEIRWDPDGSGVDPEALRGVDAVIHLAGENIAGARWTEARKRLLLSSRVTGTRLLAEAIAKAPEGPRALVSASAIGIYGSRGDEVLDENSPPGRGFLPETSTAWEEATRPASAVGVRVARIRTGLVLTPAGGLLERILLPFRLGLGGRLGDGSQWMSWISAGDVVGAYHHALTDEAVRGPVNAVAPVPVRNTEFTAALGRVLHRPTPMAVPKMALRIAVGEMADEAILASARVVPEALTRTGYPFRYADLELALAHLLGKKASG